MTDAENLTDDELVRKFYSQEQMTPEESKVAFERLGLNESGQLYYNNQEDLIRQRETAIVSAANLPNKNVGELLENADTIFAWIKSNRFHTK